MEESKITSFDNVNPVFLKEKYALNDIIHLLAMRWLTEVLLGIKAGHTRFSSIKDHMAFISDNILADRLRLLEEQQLISKEYFDENPPRVEYTLTHTGQELSNILKKLCTLGEEKTGQQ